MTSFISGLGSASGLEKAVGSMSTEICREGRPVNSQLSQKGMNDKSCFA